MKLKTFAIGLGIVVLSACASKPPPVEIAEPQQPKEEIAAPVEVIPAPVEPVVENRVPEAQEYLGPTPGTLEHFQYVSGEERVYFGYNQYNLSPLARETLFKQAQWLKDYPESIVVIGGNADERGTREYNLALGARRADASKTFLISQGVAPNRITTVSYGKERPIEPGSDEASWARNRNAHSSVLVGGRDEG